MEKKLTSINNLGSKFYQEVVDFFPISITIRTNKFLELSTSVSKAAIDLTTRFLQITSVWNVYLSLDRWTWRQTKVEFFVYMVEQRTIFVCWKNEAFLTDIVSLFLLIFKKKFPESKNQNWNFTSVQEFSNHTFFFNTKIYHFYNAWV